MIRNFVSLSDITEIISQTLENNGTIEGETFIQDIWNFYRIRLPSSSCTSSSSSNFDSTAVLSKCQVRQSVVVPGERGVFATVNIEKDEVITLYPGDYPVTDGGIYMAHGRTKIDMKQCITYGYNCGDIYLIGDPNKVDDTNFLGHICNDAAMFTSSNSSISSDNTFSISDNEQKYLIETKKCNAEPVDIVLLYEGKMYRCFCAIVANRNIAQGEEICFSYGIDHWRNIQS